MKVENLREAGKLNRDARTLVDQLRWLKHVYEQKNSGTRANELGTLLELDRRELVVAFLDTPEVRPLLQKFLSDRLTVIEKKLEDLGVEAKYERP